jgi:hypothetical protein
MIPSAVTAVNLFVILHDNTPLVTEEVSSFDR